MLEQALRLVVVATLLVLGGCSGLQMPGISDGSPDLRTDEHTPPPAFGDEPSYDNFPDNGR